MLPPPEDAKNLPPVAAVLAVIADAQPGTGPLTAESALRDSGIDSIGVVSLIMALESRFSLRFPSEALTDENFATPGAIATTVARMSQG